MRLFRGNIGIRELVRYTLSRDYEVMRPMMDSQLERELKLKWKLVPSIILILPLGNPNITLYGP